MLLAMRDFFQDRPDGAAADPMEAARKAMRAPLRPRFYRTVSVARTADGFAVHLDARPVLTPARRPLAAPTQKVADEVAQEWDAVQEAIDPASMPLTRLANSIIDGVAAAGSAVREEIAKYLESDLLFYRANQPEGLVAAQAQHWNPVLAWAQEVLGARFTPTQGVVFVAQTDEALAAARTALPHDAWRLGALHSATTLTGSALLALSLMRRQFSAQQVWAAANVDEDWQMSQWGRDEMALRRRDFRWREMQAAARVLHALDGR